MSQSFDRAFETLIGHEGGLSLRESDPGNWTGCRPGSGILKGTKYGVSACSYPAVDIRNLTLDQAKAIYKRDYWDKAKIQEVTRLYDLQFLLFDIAVNHGVKDSAVFLQRGLGVKDDGIIGPITLAAAKAANKRDLLARVSGYRLLDYAENLAHMFDEYGRGWTIRTAKNLINVGRSQEDA